MFQAIKRKRLPRLAKKDQWPAYAQSYLRYLSPRPTPREPWQGLRFVVFDTETTGLDLQQDQVLSIGAVVIEGEEIKLGDSLELVIKSSAIQAAEAIAIHGLTPEDVAAGLRGEEAAAAFLDFIKGDILVAHHVAFDLRMMERLIKHYVGESFFLYNRFLDTAHLARHLEHTHRPDHLINHSQYSLDQLCRRYDIVMHDRHTAWGDALMTAQLLLKLMRMTRENNPAQLRSLMNR